MVSTRENVLLPLTVSTVVTTCTTLLLTDCVDVTDACCELAMLVDDRCADVVEAIDVDAAVNVEDGAWVDEGDDD